MLEAMAQAGAETAVPPLNVTPVWALLRAMMQGGVDPPTSA